jgi:PAT family beta-lactamase induction signal transducer AmpG
MKTIHTHRLQPAAAGPWVISSYFAEGLPYNVVNTVAVVMLADFALSKSYITVAVSLLSLPWSLKALWSPLIDIYSTKRRWLLAAQAAVALCFAGVAAALALPHRTAAVLAALTAAAFCSATYDIACDGFYMQALSPARQSFFVGFRTTAYRLSTIFAGGALLYLAARMGWQAVFLTASALLLFFAVLHAALLPHPERRANAAAAEGDAPKSVAQALSAFWTVLRSFFVKRDLLFMLLFLLAYRLGEALLAKITCLFLIDDRARGGIGLDTAQYSFIYGVSGVSALLLGGILGGIYISRHSLRRSVLPMAVLLNVPDLLYVWMSVCQPESLWLVGSAVAIEQFGYGFGLTAYMVYMLQSVKGAFATSHYAFLTCIMALGLMLPGLISGWLQEHLGYTAFFEVACLCTLPGFAASWWLARRKG